MLAFLCCLGFRPLLDSAASRTAVLQCATVCHQPCAKTCHWLRLRQRWKRSQWLSKTTRRCCGGFAISAPWYKWLYLLTLLNAPRCAKFIALGRTMYKKCYKFFYTLEYFGTPGDFLDRSLPISALIYIARPGLPACQISSRYDRQSVYELPAAEFRWLRWKRQCDKNSKRHVSAYHATTEIIGGRFWDTSYREGSDAFTTISGEKMGKLERLSAYESVCDCRRT